MKKFIVAAIIHLLSSLPAVAGVSCALPFTLTNNTLADANQVMANFNALVSCLGNAAASGPNSDITSILGLTTPLPASEGGTSVYIANAPSTGTANAQVVASTTPFNFTLGNNKRVVFFAGSSNSGAMTLAVAGTTATEVRYRSSVGSVLLPLQGGEILANSMVDVLFNGTFYELMVQYPVPTGTILDFAGSIPPQGFVFAAGQCLLQSQFPNLFSIIGTTFGGGCPGGQFGMPDLRGRMSAGKDNMLNPASRLTFAASGCDGSTLGTGCGVQAFQLTVGQLPTFTPVFTGTPMTAPLGANATFSGVPMTAPLGVNAVFGGTPTTVPLGGNATFTGTPMTAQLGANASLSGSTQNYTPAGGINGNGGNVSFVDPGHSHTYTQASSALASAIAAGHNTFDQNTGVATSSDATGITIPSNNIATTLTFGGTTTTVSLGANAVFGGTTQSFTPAGGIGGTTQSFTPGGTLSGSTQSFTPGGTIGGATQTFTPGGTIGPIGSANTVVPLNPLIVLNKIIKY